MFNINFHNVLFRKNKSPHNISGSMTMMSFIWCRLIQLLF